MNCQELNTIEGLKFIPINGKKIPTVKEWQVISILGNDNYLVSDCGRIWSVKNGKLCKPQKDCKGYLRVRLYKNNIEAVTLKVHRVVATYFLPNPDNKPEVNHINGIKSDNRRENLEWVTTKENITHAMRTGLRVVTEKQREAARVVLTGNAYSNKKIINKTTGEVFDSVKAAAKSINLSRSALSGMLTGFRKNWTKMDYL